MILDDESFSKLDELNRDKGDDSYTYSIKRLIARGHFELEETKKGSEFYMAKKGDDRLYEIVETVKPGPPKLRVVK